MKYQIQNPHWCRKSSTCWSWKSDNSSHVNQVSGLWGEVWVDDLSFRFTGGYIIFSCLPRDLFPLIFQRHSTRRDCRAHPVYEVFHERARSENLRAEKRTFPAWKGQTLYIYINTREYIYLSCDVSRETVALNNKKKPRARKLYLYTKRKRFRRYVIHIILKLCVESSMKCKHDAKV